MSIDDEIAELERRRDVCLSAVDDRVQRMVHDTKESLSITNLVRRFPFAALGAALSAGLLASGSQKKIWAILSRLVPSAAGRHSSESGGPQKVDSAPSAEAYVRPENPASPGGGFWHRVAPVAQAAVPLLLERVPWSQIRQSIKSRLKPRPDADDDAHPPG